MQMALHGCSILVVEDDPLIGFSIAEMIRRERGTPVGPAANSKEALSAMEGSELHGALLDIALKGETVFALADAIRDRHIPFVFLTGHFEPQIPSRFRNVPVLEKPCSSGEMVSLLKAEIQRNSADADVPGEPQ